MIWQVTVGVVALVAGLGLSAAADGQEDKHGPLGLSSEHGGAATWEDQDGEATYHVFGTITFLPPPSCLPDAPDMRVESLRFDEQLPADTTSFQLPQPNDERLTLVKDEQFTIEALDAGGSVLAQDGFATIADPFCTEEDIARELAAAGTGAPGTSRRPLPAIVAWLLAGGGALLLAGVMLRSRA